MRRVLIVEDEDDLREAFAELLLDERMSVVTAKDAAQAFEALRHGPPPDVIVLDLMLPDMDGFHFRRRQLADPALARVPVVVVSALRLQTTPPFDALGDVRVLQKPFAIEELVAAVEHAGS